MSDLAVDVLHRVQLARKAILLGLILMLTGLAVFSRPLLSDIVWECVLKVGGVGLILTAIVGRGWCSLYIGGRKKAELVDLGPYSISRNPLYVFNVIGAVGIGAQTGSLMLALLFGALAIAVFQLTVRREEVWLSGAFGSTYRVYRNRTPRFLPDFRRWRDAEMLMVHPRFFMLTLRDGLVFLLAVPIFAGVEHARFAGWATPVLPLI